MVWAPTWVLLFRESAIPASTVTIFEPLPLASLLGNKNENARTVQELMRHASIKLAVKYTHGDQDAKCRARSPSGRVVPSRGEGEIALRTGLAENETYKRNGSPLPGSRF